MKAQSDCAARTALVCVHHITPEAGVDLEGPEEAKVMVEVLRENQEGSHRSSSTHTFSL